jgi:hypothetical protein
MTEQVNDRRLEVYNDMFPETQKVAHEIERLLRQENTGKLMISYDIGAKLLVVHEKEATYGSDAIQLLAAYTGIEGGDRTLHDLRNLADEYDRGWLKAQAAIPLADGRYLTRHHFLLIMKAPMKKKLDLLEQTRANSWSVKQLHDEIHSQGLVKARAPGGGRKPKPPTSPAAGLRKLTRDFRAVVNYAPLMDEGVFNKLKETAPDRIDEKLLGSLNEAQEAASGAVEVINDMIEKMKANTARVNHVLENKKKRRPQAA